MENQIEKIWPSLVKRIQSSVGCLGSFFEGLCKFAHYSKFDECGRLRNRDLVSSANVMCVLSFDRDEDHIAAGGVSKKIKIFDLNAISSDSVDIQYPAEEIYTAAVRAVKEEIGVSLVELDIFLCC
ncbi:hypothetical protein JHK82_050538 [Glycine max]|nr:hypothetical protein JHK82_050538 [Glycine max]KAG5094859.1 hypothetical protein JHK84_050447 [Glycine max]